MELSSIWSLLSNTSIVFGSFGMSYAAHRINDTAVYISGDTNFYIVSFACCFGIAITGLIMLNAKWSENGK